MNRTKIEWCDFTWSPVTGCYHGCDYCYARRIAWRFGGKRWAGIIEEFARPEEKIHTIGMDDGTRRNIKNNIYYPFGFEPTFHKYRINEPEERQKPAKIFVCSMGDLFGEWVPEEWIEQVIEVAEKCPQHTFQFLTKNPGRYYEFEFPENCWLGTTIEGNNGENTYHRYWALNEAKASVKYISFEPLLGMADIEDMLVHANWIDWVIVGALTGPKSKQPDTKWVDRIIDDCKFHGIPVFIKDNLDWPEKIQEWPKEMRVNHDNN